MLPLQRVQLKIFLQTANEIHYLLIFQFYLDIFNQIYSREFIYTFNVIFIFQLRKQRGVLKIDCISVHNIEINFNIKFFNITKITELSVHFVPKDS